MKPTRAFFAEFFGTAALLAVVVGSGIMAETLAKGNTAVALLANSIATGAGLFVLIMLFAPTSGAHFNPAVSLMARLHQQLDNRQFVLHLLAQFSGAVLGVWLAHAMFDQAIWQQSSTVRASSNLWIAEFVATFGLLITIQGATSVRGGQSLSLPCVAAMVALYIVAAYWFTASTSFANPAVTLARSLTNTFAGIRPVDVGGFVVTQLVASLAASFIGKWMFEES